MILHSYRVFPNPSVLVAIRRDIIMIYHATWQHIFKKKLSYIKSEYKEMNTKNANIHIHMHSHTKL